MKKISIFVAIFIFCMHNAFGAKDVKCTQIQITCPAGLFCTANGKYTAQECKFGKSTYLSGEIQPYQIGPAELVAPGWGMWSDEGLCDARTNHGSSFCIYYASDYDEVWVSAWFGFYMVKNDNITYNSSANGVQGVFPCPGTYPSSDVGASSVFQCYRIIGDGEKEYFTTPKDTVSNYDGRYNTDSINVMLTNLQSALEQAQTAAKNLQNVLKKSNTKIRVSIPVTQSQFNNISNETKNVTNATINESTTNDTTTEEASTSPLTNPIKNIKLSTTTSGFDWGKFDGANLFTTSVDAKSAIPVNVRKRMPNNTGAKARSSTVVRSANSHAVKDTVTTPRQNTVDAKNHRPISGKNINGNVSNTVFRHTK